jgi:hypothetical protein
MGEQILLTNVPGYGWLCVGMANGEEWYRGEYQQSYYESLRKYEEALERKHDE